MKKILKLLKRYNQRATIGNGANGIINIVLPDGGWIPFNSKKQLKAYLVEHTQGFKYEVGKVYKNGRLLMMCTEILNDNTFRSYGFISSGRWVYNDVCNSSNWEEATKKEWESALIKEAEKRGFVDGVKFILIEGTVGEVNKYEIVDINYDLRTNNHLIATTQRADYTIMKDGKWAEIIEEKKVLFTTEDGVDMYDDGHGVSTEKVWKIHVSETRLMFCCSVVVDKDYYKLFHKKENAIKHIEQRDWKENVAYHLMDIDGNIRLAYSRSSFENFRVYKDSDMLCIDKCEYVKCEKYVEGVEPFKG